MPWKQTNIMEQRFLFLKAWLSQRYTKIALCRQFNISRPTADKWIKRHEQVGFEGLNELSRRPHTSPNATAEWIVEWLIAEKLKRPDWGPKKLLDLFAKRYPDTKVPADSTGDLILARAGLVKPRRKRRRQISADNQRFTLSVSPNTTWCVDFKGQFLLRNRQWCYPLTVTDNYSRYILSCHALPSPQSTLVKQQFERLFEEYGLPWVIRSDNGPPFSSIALGGISRLSKWWIDLGIRPERTEPAHPEQNGRHERMHRSLKLMLKERKGQYGKDIQAQQIILDDFR